jgi:hypothetical protein
VPDLVVSGNVLAGRFLKEVAAMFMEDLTKITQATTFAFSAENPTGQKGGGSRGKPWEKLRASISVSPGETIVLADMAGPGVIQSLWFGGYTGWNFILRIYWDEQKHPSVESPLSAFFGYGFNGTYQDASGQFPTLNSSAVLVAPCRGMNSYWPMPFRRHCLITLENRSTTDIRSTYYMITGKKADLSDDCGYFHASYRQSRPMVRNQEYTVLDNIRGTGHYVGTALFVGVNGNNGCWVEGEAKMYLDGDIYPSINYTGIEDYFCGSYAFGYDSALQKYQAYSGQYGGMFAIIGDNNIRYHYQPRFMLYRWHIPDPIHFSSDFRMTLQNLGGSASGTRSRRDDFASVAYWYQTLPSEPLRQLPADEDLDME